MIQNKKILLIVPARGGSKGIKLKNIQLVNGVPLIELTGRVIAQLAFVDRAVVSTDHPDIISIAKKSGLDAPFVRPENISGDIISDWEVLNHALLETEKIDREQYDVVVMLQPTCPLRKPEHVTQTVKKLIEGNYDAVWTISETDSKNHPLKQLIFEDDRLDYYDKKGAKIIARQQLGTIYHRNGAAYAITRECLTNKKSIKGEKTSAVIINDSMISIDTEHDFRMVEYFTKQE